MKFVLDTQEGAIRRYPITPALNDQRLFCSGGFRGASTLKGQKMTIVVK